jgi:hypothetical protein
MQTILLLAVALVSIGGALSLAHHFHTRWYWHVLGFAAALAWGLIPNLSLPDIMVGGIFVFLIAWGLGPALFRLVPHRHTSPPWFA